MMMKAENNEIYRASRTRYPARNARPVRQEPHHDPEAGAQARRTLLTLAVAVVVFLACTGLIYFKCLISATQIEICRLQDEIDSARNENSRLEAVHTEAVNLDAIRLSAQELGMGYPQDGQIRYLDSAQSLDSGEGEDTSLQTSN